MKRKKKAKKIFLENKRFFCFVAKRERLSRHKMEERKNFILFE